MSAPREDGGSAFPQLRVTQDHAGSIIDIDHGEPGLSVRDYFAAKALQGMCADGSIHGSNAEIAGTAYALADAMLKARKEPAP